MRGVQLCRRLGLRGEDAPTTPDIVEGRHTPRVLRALWSVAQACEGRGIRVRCCSMVPLTYWYGRHLCSCRLLLMRLRHAFRTRIKTPNRLAHTPLRWRHDTQRLVFGNHTLQSDHAHECLCCCGMRAGGAGVCWPGAGGAAQARHGQPEEPRKGAATAFSAQSWSMKLCVAGASSSLC